MRQAVFFCQDVDATDTRFDVNKDVVDGQLVNEDESSQKRRSRRKRRARRRMRKLPWRVMIKRRRRTFIFYDLKLVMSSTFVIIRTLFYFAFNMMNAFVYAMLFIGCR